MTNIFAIEHNYKNVAYFFIIAGVLSAILFSVALFLSLNTVNDREKLSEYECGFEPFDSATRHPFDVHFYVVGILFLIFDVEIAILFPWVLGLKTIGWLGINTMLCVLFILTIGFVYEWKRGALIWPSRK
jgi:NADH-quinone oxidoreductase subunit A